MSKATVKSVSDIALQETVAIKSVKHLKSASGRKSTRKSSELQSEAGVNAEGDDDVFEETAKIPEETRSSSGGSGQDSKSSSDSEAKAKSRHTTLRSAKQSADLNDDDEYIKHSFGKRLTELKANKAPTPPPAEPSLRDTLLAKYYALLKEKRELRKRNAQAQTNICQYLRKHNIDLFSASSSADPDKSQAALREEYTQMLNRIEDLADIKDEEKQEFEAHMEEINGKKNLLQNEIVRLTTEIGQVKMRTVNQPQLDRPQENVMVQKDVAENIKYLESLEEEMKPVRLEYVQLKRAIDAIQNKYDHIFYEQEEAAEQTELTIENQVLSDEVEATKEELSKMQHVMNNDVVVLTHVQMKHTQMEAENTKMFMEAQAGGQKITELKSEEFRLKGELMSLQDKYRKLEENIGLLGNKPLLKDYSNTLVDIDSAQRRIELDEPLSLSKRSEEKATKTA